MAWVVRVHYHKNEPVSVELVEHPAGVTRAAAEQRARILAVRYGLKA